MLCREEICFADFFFHMLQVKVEPIILEGDPREMIRQAVEQMHPDIVVVGSRGLNKLKRYTFTF